MFESTNVVFDERNFGEYLEMIYERSSKENKDLFMNTSSTLRQRTIENFKANLISIAEKGIRKVNVFFSNIIIEKIGIDVETLLSQLGISYLFDKQTDEGEYWLIFIDANVEDKNKESFHSVINFF